MALQGASKNATIEYVSDLDPAKRKVEVPIDPDKPELGKREEVVIDEDATVFILGNIDTFTLGRIYDKQQKMTYGAEGTSLDSYMNATAIEACVYGVRGWRNFKDADGQDIPYLTVKKFEGGRTYEKLDDASLNALGPELAFELGTKLKSMSQVTAAERKN